MLIFESSFFFYGLSISAILLIIFGIFLIKIGKSLTKKSENKNAYLGQIITGWSILATAITLYVLYFILYINAQGGISGTFVFTMIAPLFIFIGFVICIGIGASSLVEGYRKNNEGQRDKVAIIRGWFLLVLAIIVVVIVIVTLSILFNDYSNSRGDTPVRMM